MTSLKRKSLKPSAECTNPYEFWKRFKSLIPVKSSDSQCIQLLEQGQFITDNTEIANAFNNYFVNCGSVPTPSSDMDFSAHPSIALIKQRYGHLSFSFHPVEVHYVLKIL